LRPALVIPMGWKKPWPAVATGSLQPVGLARGFLRTQLKFGTYQQLS